MCVHEYVHVQSFLLYVCTGACIRVPVVLECMYICLLSKIVCAHAYVSLLPPTEKIVLKTIGSRDLPDLRVDL